MEAQELQEYLGIALDMEKNIFLRNRLIETLTARRDQLGIPKTFSAPVKPQEQAVMSDGAEILPLSTDGGIWEGQARKDERGMGHMEIAAWNRYHDALTAYRLDIAKDKARLLVENRERSLLSQEIDELVRFQAESVNRLGQIYDKNIVFPKYRNLIALSSLYEYICAGRCYALEGPEGAYNIYEAESRFDKIVTRLDQVIVHLDAIRDNQYVLFSAMQETNRQYEQFLDAVQILVQQGGQILGEMQRISHGISEQSDRISEQADRIRGHTAQISAQLSELRETSALAVYHAERTQKELHYMNQMDFWSGRNDGVFFNLPPH